MYRRMAYFYCFLILRDIFQLFNINVLSGNHCKARDKFTIVILRQGSNCLHIFQ